MFFKNHTFIKFHKKLTVLILLLLHPSRAAFLLKYYIKRNIADLRSYHGYFNYPYKIIFLAGMPMSATTWMKNLIARIPGYYSRPISIPYDIAVRQDIVDSAFKYAPSKGYALYKTHLNPNKDNLDCIERNGVKKIIVTYRDLRDVVISRYYRLIDFPKSKGDPNFMDYNAMGKEKAIDHSIEVVSTDYVPWIKGWLDFEKKNNGKCLFIRFEDLRTKTKEEFLKVLSFYGISLPEMKVNEIIAKSRGRRNVKDNFNRAKFLPYSLASNFRKGKTGGWKSEMTDEQINRCKEHFGKLLIELGYEKNMDWQE